MVEVGSKTIWSWGFTISHVFENKLHLFKGDRSHKSLIVLSSEEPRNVTCNLSNGWASIRPGFKEKIFVIFDELLSDVCAILQEISLLVFEFLYYVAMSSLHSGFVEEFGVTLPFL